MRRSILLGRIILLLLITVILSGLLTAGIYIFVTRRMYADMRAGELMPAARSIASMLADVQTTESGELPVWPLFERNGNFFGAMLHVYDADGKPHTGFRLNNIGVKPPPEDLSLSSVINVYFNTILAGDEVSEISAAGRGQSFLVVGVPITSQGVVTGAVIFTKPMSELNEVTRGMNYTLLASTLAAFIIMLLPGYLLARRLVVPIRQMENVARAMSDGDFSVRADESQKGEIGELARSMNRFAVESGRLEQTRRDYVANVSHELRTPIAAIRAMGETLRDGMAKTPEKQELFYGNIVRESMRLSRLVDDLLELSSLQSDAEPIKKAHFDLGDSVRNTADVYSHVAAEAGLNFELYIDTDSAIPVFSNRDRIEQVLVILLDNAMKHTPPDGTVRLAVSQLSGCVELTVTDTGDGIPAEDLPHIFERFYTVDKSHSGSGTGLGLSIAHEIMKRLGETITAASNNDGAVFRITVSR